MELIHVPNCSLLYIYIYIVGHDIYIYVYIYIYIYIAINILLLKITNKVKSVVNWLIFLFLIRTYTFLNNDLPNLLLGFSLACEWSSVPQLMPQNCP